MGMKLHKDDHNVLNLGFLEALSKIRTFEKRILKEEKVNLTPKELNNLVIIKYHPDLKQSQILELLDVSKGTFSTIIKILVGKGFIIQVQDEKDKRIKRIAFTEKGEHAMEINRKIRKEIRDHLLTRLTESELDIFIDIALKMR